MIEFPSHYMPDSSEPKPTDSLVQQYERSRNPFDEAEWCRKFTEVALSPNSPCHQADWSSFNSDVPEFPGCSAYHA